MAVTHNSRYCNLTKRGTSSTCVQTQKLITLVVIIQVNTKEVSY